METAVVARHAESRLGAEDRLNGDPRVANPLTDVGRAQARRLGRLLERSALDVVVSSELERVRETAELALDDRDVPMIVVPDLNEIRFGSFEGGPAESYLRWAWSHGPDEPCPGGGEARTDAVRRLARGFRTVLERPEATILIVGHGLALRYLLNAAGGADPRPKLANVPLAEPAPVSSHEFRRAVERLERWLEAPAW